MSFVFVAGLVLLAAGCGMVYLPAGLIAAGVLLMLVALAWVRGGLAERR